MRLRRHTIDSVDVCCVELRADVMRDVDQMLLNVDCQIVVCRILSMLVLIDVP